MSGATTQRTPLGASPTLWGLPEPVLRLLARAGVRETFEAGEELPTDGVPRLYLLESGEVAATAPPDEDGVSELVGHEGPGGVFGSAPITEEEDVPVYRAVGFVEALVWEQPELDGILGEVEGLRRQLETRLSLRRRRTELVDLVRRTALFRQASQALTRSLVGSATLARFDPGEIVCREGDEGDAMFLIVAGEVEIAQAQAADPLQHLHRGDVFGEIALIQGTPRVATATAVGSCEILVIGREAFDALYRRSASFRHAVRLTAELRLEANRARRPDPELVWLVNDSGRSSEQLAALVAAALRETVGPVPAAARLDGGGGVAAALEAADAAGATYALCVSGGDEAKRIGREVVERAGGIVHFADDAAAPFPYEGRTLQRVQRVVVAGPDSAPGRAWRDAVALSLPHDVDGASLEDLPSGARDGLGRIARAIAHRRVGVALGGGAAWGYAHVALLRALERAEIPVDLLVGVSVGSLVGAFYASSGTDGLDRLVDAKLELTAAAGAAVLSTSSVGLFLRRHVPETRIEELPLPFAAVAVDARSGREKVFRHGSLATAVRASCSLPGVFGRPLFGGHRYLDACVRNNVPASYCSEADVDFVIACDVVPTPKASRDMRSGFRSFALELLQVNRVTDTIRSLYWLASDSGRAQASLADALFAPDLSEFFPWDFHRADAIVERAEEQVDDWLPTAQARYRALARTGRANA
jgi:predicted acylesterase/phospholipase RssA/CRP-like cAMP-binding protein